MPHHEGHNLAKSLAPILTETLERFKTARADTQALAPTLRAPFDALRRIVTGVAEAEKSHNEHVQNVRDMLEHFDQIVVGMIANPLVEKIPQAERESVAAELREMLARLIREETSWEQYLQRNKPGVYSQKNARRGLDLIREHLKSHIEVIARELESPGTFLADADRQYMGAESAYRNPPGVDFRNKLDYGQRPFQGAMPGYAPRGPGRERSEPSGTDSIITGCFRDYCKGKASLEDWKRCYRQLALKLHPDKGGKDSDFHPLSLCNEKVIAHFGPSPTSARA